jgi:aspartate kinase
MLVVQKFGGTSMGNIERIKSVAGIIMETLKEGKKLAVVVSAKAGDTDILLSLFKEVSTKEPSKAELSEMDNILSTGERLSSALLATFLISQGINARSFTGLEAGIFTDENFGNAKIQDVLPDKILNFIKEGGVPIITGFQGFSLKEERITTLGRGGSDTSALALACALKAEKCEIYKDVEGVYTTDPRFVKTAAKLPFLDYSSAMEITAGGAKVLEARAASFASKYKMKVHILSSFKKSDGSIIEERINEEPIVQNISIEEKYIFAKLSSERSYETFDKLIGLGVSFSVLSMEKLHIYLLIFKTDLYKVDKSLFQEIQEEIYMLSIVGSFFGKPDILISCTKILEAEKCEIIFTLSAQSRVMFVIKGKNSTKTLETLHKNLFK